MLHPMFIYIIEMKVLDELIIIFSNFIIIFKVVKKKEKKNGKDTFPWMESLPQVLGSLFSIAIGENCS